MPGKIIKLFDTQADWQSGVLENLDATTTPGAIVPTGDFVKTYDTQADWDGGTKNNVVSDADGNIKLIMPTVYNAASGNVTAAADIVYFGQRISCRGLLSYVAMSINVSAGGGRQLLVTKLNGAILWSKDFSSSDLWSGNPNLLVSEDVVVWAKCYDELQVVAASDYPPGVTEKGRKSTNTTWPAYSEHTTPIYVQYVCEYAASGTWLSPWLAHGITSPESGVASVVASTPAGTAVAVHTRYSTDGGSTYGAWQEVIDKRMQGVTGTHVQARLTLSTTNAKDTPSVDKVAVIVSKIHRWTSPVINIAGAGDTLMMVAISQTDLDVRIEITAGEDQYAFVGPSQPIYLETPWGLVGMVFPNPEWRSIKIRLTMSKTDATTQSLDAASLWDAIVLKMLDRPELTLSPPQITHVTAYVDKADPPVQSTASLAVPAAKKVHIRIAVPAGSDAAYCQQVAAKVLAIKSKERISLVCRVPLVTRLRFGELVPVAIPYAGYTRDKPYVAKVQAMRHDVLAKPPYTEITLGEPLFDDAETIVRLFKAKG